MVYLLESISRIWLYEFYFEFTIVWIILLCLFFDILSLKFYFELFE